MGMQAGQEEAALRARRREIHRLLHNAKDPPSVYRFHKALSEELLRTEKAAKERRTEDLKFHRRMLLRLGDSLTHRLLSAHAVRQLGEMKGAPPGLVNQPDHHEAVMEIASDLAERGQIALVADLTNVIRVSDIVLCFGPENFTLVEVKTTTKDSYRLKARDLRQTRRARRVQDYLKTGRTNQDGPPKVAIETNIRPLLDPEGLAAAVAMAMKDGICLSRKGEGDVLVCIRGDIPQASPSATLREAEMGMAKPSFGFLGDTIDNPDPMLVPPAAHDLDEETSWIIMEREVIVLHVVDLEAFAVAAAQRNRVLRVIPLPDGACEFKMEVSGQVVTLGTRYVRDVIYGLESIQTVADRMIEAAEHALKLDRPGDL